MTREAALLDTKVARQVRQEIADLTEAGLDQRTLLGRALTALGRAVPIDAAGACTTDPATLLWTGGVMSGLPIETTSTFFENELFQPDVLKFRTLTRTPGQVGVLSEATRGELDRSRRYQSMYLPSDMSHELRAVLAAGGASWATVCLVRHTEQPDFTPAEARYVTAVGRQIAHGLRTAALPRCDELLSAPEGPGLLLIGGDGQVQTMNTSAERWLAELSADLPAGMLPPVVQSVLARAKSWGDDRIDMPPRARVLTSQGWLAVHASAMAGGHWAIVLEPAGPGEVEPLMAHAYDLTDREREILGHLLRGASLAEIVARLVVSDHTARNHVKAIQRKVGVNSRAELQAKFYAEQYSPWADVASRN